MTGIAAASFFSNTCRFGGCGLHFPTLADLIEHIEDNHIGEARVGGGWGGIEGQASLGVARAGRPKRCGRGGPRGAGMAGRRARARAGTGRGGGGRRVPHAASARPELSGWREPGRRRRGSHSASSPACVLSAPVARCGAAGGGRGGGGRGALRAPSGAGAGPGLALRLRFGRPRAAPIPGRSAPRPRRRSGARGRRAGVARRGVAARPEVRPDPRGLRGAGAGEGRPAGPAGSPGILGPPKSCASRKS